MIKNKWHIGFGIASALIFIGLLAVRLGFFEKETSPLPASQAQTINRFPETWMNIYQKKQKIGVVQRTFHSLSNGRFQTEEKVTMQISTMGVSQILHIRTESELNPDMSFSSFSFELSSSLFRFSARGFVKNDKLIIFSGLPSAQQKTVLPYQKGLHITGNIYEASFRQSLPKNTSQKFQIFDPSTLSVRPVAVSREGDEIIPIMGKQVLTQKYCADFMGAKNCAWLSKDGEIVKETGILGISLVKVNDIQAKEGLAAGVDMTQMASIPSNVVIDDPQKLAEIRFKVEGISGVFLLLHGGRQTFAQNILTIRRESLSDGVEPTDLPPFMRKFLQSSALIQSDAPEIQKQMEKIVHRTADPQMKLQKIVDWVYRTLEKKPVLSVPNALEILQLKSGDCNEHAVITAALLRAAGIPSQIETGLVYLNGRFYYHAWNTAYVGRWITADAVFNQIPADVTHIRLTRGEGAEQLNLLGVMGKIRLEVLSLEK